MVISSPRVMGRTAERVSVNVEGSQSHFAFGPQLRFREKAVSDI